MIRFVVSYLSHCFQLLSHCYPQSFASKSGSPFFKRYLGSILHLSHSANTRLFPDYSPKKPTVKDSELVHQISNAIKLRRSEPLSSNYLIWVLMNIKGKYTLVLDFFEWACLHRDPTLKARCIVIQIDAASKDLKMAHQLIHDFWSKPDLDIGLSFSYILERLIYTYKDWVLVELGLLDEGKKLFGKFLNYGLIISVDSLNIYLSKLRDHLGGFWRAVKVFFELPDVGSCWNTASYNIIIHSLCKLGKIKEAHRLLLQLELRGCIPDVVTYNTIIDGYCHMGRLQMALRIIDEMQSYSSVIYLLCEIGKVVQAKEALREMLNQGILSDSVVYTTLIDGFCKLGNIAFAYKLLNEMQEACNVFQEILGRGLEPDEFTYTALIDGYCKAGEMKKAFSLYNLMVQMGLIPNVVTYTALADGLCKCGEVDTTNELLHEMCGRGLQPNMFTYNSLVNGLCK
ncbi:hypothetical protein ES319_D06G000200v1 [Gossypium barbadense]|uniref:Pentacotripeptide-repeat region of PRORP domain-containing protein n=1 Tax=Gossypium barbadense TaxID=3634 RepID=A0A5J5QYN7_GOSBA|nr:hypothetical protein ES319_D06G000200v1 [Gossypium barbadense]